MKRLCIFIAAILGLVMPSKAMAGTPYTIRWLFTSEDPQCVHATIVEGHAFFDANGTPLPTYSIPGAFTQHPNGFESNLAEAGFDSVLLRMGANEFGFGVANVKGNDYCTKQSNIVTLMAPTLGIEKLLFNIRRDGTAFSGSTNVDLKLEEINPQLAQDIAILDENIAELRKELVRNADRIADLDERLDALQQLETELGDLLRRPLDEISVEDLDEILARYSSIVDAATREALKQVLLDLKKSIDDLHAELASLMANFGEQADAVSDFLTGDARQSGFQPDDPTNYGLGVNDVPWVEVPDISNVPGAFDPANDPYAAYADEVIASLAQDVAGNLVVGRANFVAEVRAWRSNQAALEKAIQARMSVSQAETSAFLKAQNKVTGYLRKFMDESGWFHDAPIPQDVRADVDGTLKNLYGALAEDLKDRLNAWEAKWYPESNLLFDTVRAFAAGISYAGEVAENYVHVMKSIVHGASRIGIGFVPFVGPALDLCEAVTGKELCLPSGKTLTTGERIFSGIGFGIGKVVKIWTGVGKAAISAEGKAVAAGIVTLGDGLSELAKARQIRTWRALTVPAHVDVGDLYKLESVFEREVVRRLLQDGGHRMLAPSDVMVRKILNIEKGSITGSTKACDFITVTNNDMLVLSELKGFDKGQINVEHALEQLRNVMKALGKKNLEHGVERVQIFVPKGSLKKLNGDYFEEAGRLIDKNKQPVILKNQGREDLIVQLVEL